MRRAGRPALSPLRQQVLDPYERQLRTGEDLTAATIRNYLSDLHRFGYRMAASVPLHRLAQLMGHDSLDTTMRSVQATTLELQQDIERIAWR